VADMKAKKVARLIAVCAIVIAFLVFIGTGKQGYARRVARPHAVVRTIVNPITDLYKSLDEDGIVDGHLVTYGNRNLSGKLPPIEPVTVVTRGNPRLKRVAITIDDGWKPDMRILDLLKKWKIKFTAFVIGGRGVAETHPGFVRQIQESGGEVCNHTYSHYIMKGKAEAWVKEDIWRSQEILTRITHNIYPYVRYCGGDYDNNSLTWAEQQGFWLVNWTVSSNDTVEGVTADSQVDTVLNNLEPGAIILFHFGGYNTYEVLARTIPEMQKRGYEVTSLSRVFEGTPYLLKESTGMKHKNQSIFHH
jgi:peptidoglycan/xylan/chitin deacetylase (PgdA/CDA1 family)